MNIPDHFRLTSSKGTPWLQSYILEHSATLAFSEAFKVSKKLHQTILKVNKEVKEQGLPSNFYLAHVHEDVQTGVFLRPDAAPVESGSFIGVYTGLYELVEGDIGIETSYAYDVAQELTLDKDVLHNVVKAQKKLCPSENYSIQTNAMQMGNFTRYINHTSIAPNVEAVVSKFPDGKLEILLFAKHTINPGEQLLSCYGGQYWKTLSIIPNDMKADTYTLSPSYTVVLSNPLEPVALEHRKLAMPLRNIQVELHEELEKHPLVKSLKRKLPKATRQQLKNIDVFEDFVLELGIPRKWTPSTSKGLFKVSLKEQERTIAKNTFIGFIAGTFSLSPTKNSILVAISKKGNVYLDYSKEKNFLSSLPLDSKKGNVIFRLIFDSKAQVPTLLAFAGETIRPKDSLTLSEVIPVTL